MPFGQARTDIGLITETDYGYTGQRDLDPGMGGLMDYKARLYSPLLGRFVQPDTIIPNSFIPQMRNRFSYVGNNPIRFNDPSGHEPKGPESCYTTISGVCVDTKGTPTGNLSTINKQLSQFEITAGAGVPEEYQRNVLAAALVVGTAFAGVGESAQDAYKSEFNPLEIIFDPLCEQCRNVSACGKKMSGSVMVGKEEVNCTPGGAYSPEGGHQIIIASLAEQAVRNIVHEMGHVYDHQHGDVPRSNMSPEMYNNRSLFLYPNSCGGCFDWQFNITANEGETFGDTFVAWVYGAWNPNPDIENINAVRNAQNWMHNGLINGIWSPTWSP